MSKLKFNELSLSEEMSRAIEDMGFTEASPIQSQAIPFILAGRDIIGQAQTGTGKTAAFGIPLLEQVDASDKSIQGVIMCPTRELAVQVSNEIKKLAKYKKGLNSLAIYGGESIDKQISALKRGVQIIIGTPGRIIDHLDRKTLKFDQVKMVVLDEADEMLNMGFREDIEMILSKMPKERQTIFFSATMAKPIMALTKKYQVNPELVKITRDELTVASIEQLYFEVRASEKMQMMCRLIDMHNLQLMLVFCNTKKKVDEVVQELMENGHKAEGLHGDLRQNQRNQVMGKFRNGQVNILVATDVAARGIDVDNVDAVFNYDLPLDDEYYVHRIGRTGRAGKFGKAFTLATSRDSSRLRQIQSFTKVKIEKGALPSEKEMAEFKKNKLVEKLKAVMEGDKLSKFEKMLDEMESEGLELKQIAAALLKLTIGEPKPEKKREERPERSDRGDRFEGGERRERRRITSDNDGERSYERKSFDGPDRKRPQGRSTNGSKMVRLFVNLGKKDKIRPGDIVGAFAGESNISGDLIGSIDIYDKFSFVEIPEDILDQVLDGMENNSIKGKKVNLEVAKDK